jgi:hypothetical protein
MCLEFGSILCLNKNVKTDIYIEDGTVIKKY